MQGPLLARDPPQVLIIFLLGMINGDMIGQSLEKFYLSKLRIDSVFRPKMLCIFFLIHFQSFLLLSKGRSI